jgi:radical SAM protein with 4Fe4S-binding SPASM domain
MELVAFAKSCNPFDYIFSFEKPCLVKEEVNFEGGLLPHEISKQIQELIYPTLADAGIPFKIDYMFPQCHLPEDFASKLESEERLFSGCHLLSGKSIIFDPDGKVLPCNHLITCPLGQYGVDFATAKEYLAWREYYMNSEDFKISSSAPSERCAQCQKWEKCGAGCRLFWLFKGEDILLPSNK